MATDTEVPGILIEFDTLASEGHSSFVAKFRIAKRRLSEPRQTNNSRFVTNSEIRSSLGQLLKRWPYNDNPFKYFGLIRLKVNGQVAQFDAYNPLRHSPTFGLLDKLGIAQLLEYRALQQCKKIFPSVKIIKHPTDFQGTTPSAPRKAQLRNRGTDILVRPGGLITYRFEDGMRKLREKIGRDARKHRPRV